MEGNNEPTPETPIEQDAGGISPRQGQSEINDKLEAIFADIEKVGKAHGIDELVLIFRTEEMKDPYLFFMNPNNNHHYDAATLMATAMRNIKSKIVQELDC